MMADSRGLEEHVERLRALSFKVGMYRPPSEGGSASMHIHVRELMAANSL